MSKDEMMTVPMSESTAKSDVLNQIRQLSGRCLFKKGNCRQDNNVLLINVLIRVITTLS